MPRMNKEIVSAISLGTYNMYKEVASLQYQISIFTIQHKKKKNTYPIETNSFNLSRSTAFFKGVIPYRFCSLEASYLERETKENKV